MVFNPLIRGPKMEEDSHPLLWRVLKLLDRLKMSLMYKTTKRIGVQTTLLGSQHFGGVKGHARASWWDHEELTSFNYLYKLAQNQHKLISA